MRLSTWRMAATLAALAVVAAAPVISVAAPAAAATSDDVEFSRDGGATWSSRAPEALFGAGFVAVPGDRLETTLLIRSTRDEPTLAMVAITHASTTDPMFDAALTVRGADASGAGLADSRLSALDECAAVVPTRVLQRGQALPVTIAISISPTLERQQAANATARFDLEVSLSDVGAPTLPNGCPVAPAVLAAFPGADGGSAATGAASTATVASGARVGDAGAVVAYPTLAAVVGALVVGWLVALASRRRRTVAPPVRHRARPDGRS